MILDIQTFRSNTPNAFLKPTNYLVQFPLPPIMGQLQIYPTLLNQARVFQYRTDTADLMGAGFLTHNVVHFGYGASRKKPFAPQFNDLMITFYNSNFNQELSFFQNWLNVIQGFNLSSGIVNSGNINASQPYELFFQDDYAVNANFTLINSNDKAVCTYIVRRMWPVQIIETKMGWALVQDIMRITVMFTYVDWYLDVNAGGTLINSYQNSAQIGGLNPQTIDQVNQGGQPGPAVLTPGTPAFGSGSIPTVISPAQQG